MTPDAKITFKRLETTDLSLIFEWINEPHVESGYHQAGPYNFQDVLNDFHPEVLEAVKIQGHLICCDEKPIGYIQNYRLSKGDYEYVNGLPIEGAGGFDVFIGDPDYVNRGLGTKILFHFLSEITFSEPDIVACIINPKFGNSRAIKVYEKLGFKKFAVVELPGYAAECIMRLEKEDLRYAGREESIRYARTGSSS